MLIFIKCAWVGNIAETLYNVITILSVHIFITLAVLKTPNHVIFIFFFECLKRKTVILPSAQWPQKNMTESIELLIFTQTDEPNIRRSLDGYLQRRKTLAFMANSFFSVSFSKNSIPQIFSGRSQIILFIMTTQTKFEKFWMKTIKCYSYVNIL